MVVLLALLLWARFQSVLQPELAALALVSPWAYNKRKISGMPPDDTMVAVLASFL